MRTSARTPPEAAAAASLPLVRGLEGALLRTDPLMEMLVAYLRKHPLGIVLVLWWRLCGRARLERELARRTACDVDLWPIDEGLAEYARNEASSGRVVVLATAASSPVADRIRARFPFVSEALAADGKAERVSARFPGGFVDARDLSVWHRAEGTIGAGRGPGLAEGAAGLASLGAAFAERPERLRTWAKALRLQQWAKNALLFVPLVLGGKGADPAAAIACIIGFLGMGALASSSYLINDLLDLDDDRRHWSKRARPLASGALPLAAGLLAAPAGMAIGFALGYLAAGPPGVLIFAAYLATTIAYSLGLKRIAIVDSYVLAALFTLRLGIGIVLAEVAPSAWLLVFSMFLFTSLSLAKRATEVQRMQDHGHRTAPGRDYRASDLDTVAGFGAASAVAAVLIFVLYLIEEAFAKSFYGAPQLLWLLPALLAVWLGRIWLLCGRGELGDDPVAFALEDPASLALAALMAAAFVGAAWLPA